MDESAPMDPLALILKITDEAAQQAKRKQIASIELASSNQSAQQSDSKPQANSKQSASGQLFVRLDEDLLARLRGAAAAKRLPVSALVRQWVLTLPK